MIREYALGALLLVASVTPLLRTPPRDSFPFSTYPMFSRTFEGREVVVPHVVARHADGSERPVPPEAFGTEEVMLARTLVRRAVEGGDPRALCERAAHAYEDDPSVRSIEVRTDAYDVLGYFAERRPVRPGIVHARCAPRAR